MGEEEKTILAKNIRNTRLNLGLTQEQFAGKFSSPLSKGMVSRWERAKTSPNRKRLKEIADFAEIKVEDLLKK